jgi:outer membrane lipoprotein-sorting protein
MAIAPLVSGFMEGVSMLGPRALALAAALAAPAAAIAQAPAGLAQAQAHLRAVTTMTASFTQSDGRGRTLTGTLTGAAPIC